MISTKEITLNMDKADANKDGVKKKKKRATKRKVTNAAPNVKVLNHKVHISGCPNIDNECAADDPDDPLPESQTDKKIDATKDKPAECDKCLYCSVHRIIVQPKKRYECKECKTAGVRRVFASSEKLDLHIKETHEDDDFKLIFLCHECTEQNVFSTKAKYLHHVSIKHPGVMRFVCEICASIFKLKANFKLHMACHNIKPVKHFSCDVCKGSFVNRAGLESHMKRFPGPHIKQVCIHCGFSFSKERHMQNHRCKKLLLEEAANRAAEAEAAEIQQAAELEDKQMPQIFRHIPLSAEEPVVIQGVATTADSDQIIIRELSGQIVPNNQILHFDLTDSLINGQQVYQVNVADWNIVAPYVIRDVTALERSVQ